MSTAPGCTMYSRWAVPPPGRRTTSRRTCNSAPSNTASDDSVVSIRCTSGINWCSVVIEPILRDKKIGIQARLRRFGLRAPRVTPLHDRRQRHQNRLRSPGGLQTEQRAAVPYQIEFDIAAAAIRLEIALALAERRVLAPHKNGRVRIEEVI